LVHKANVALFLQYWSHHRQSAEEEVIEIGLQTGGGLIHVQLSIMPSFYGKFRRLAVSDITALDGAEKIARDVAAFRQSQKIETFSQFASGMAHEFNNVLTVIQGYASLLQTQRELPAELAEPVDMIAKSAERATHLTQQLQAFGQQGELHRTPLDLNETLLNLANLLRHLLGDRISLQLAYAPSLSPVMADRGSFEQMILNLAANARDAMPEGGELLISTDNVDLTEEDAKKNSDARPGSFVRLTIADSGCGMDEKVLQRIFDPFFTTKASCCGLGLPTVYTAVKRHEGWVEVKSEKDKGTSFQIYLPAAGEPKKNEFKPANIPEQSGDTILVVEDEPDVRALVARQLRREGYRVIEAKSGAEALGLWPEHAEEIKLLLTDVVIPMG